jgi:hypothetical protein
VIQKGGAIEDASVGKSGGDDASVSETRGLDASTEVEDTVDSDEGKRLECGRFYTISPLHSDDTTSVHFSRPYLMLDVLEQITSSRTTSSASEIQCRYEG